MQDTRTGSPGIDTLTLDAAAEGILVKKAMQRLLLKGNTL